MIVFIFVISFLNVVICEQCTLPRIKNILDGCDNLVGLNVTSVGGTVVNDHNCNVVLPKQVFAEEPSFKSSLADAQMFYTIIMLDPDAAPRFDGEFYLHMLKCNVPGLAINVQDATKTGLGIDFRGYKPPTPPRGSGDHRYISLLFRQTEGNNFVPNVPNTRTRFPLIKWLKGKNLCGPVAATQFRARF